MKSVDETVLSLSSLNKVLAEKGHLISEKQRERLTIAVFVAIMQSEPKPATNNNHSKQEGRNAVVVRNR